MKVVWHREMLPAPFGCDGRLAGVCSSLRCPLVLHEQLPVPAPTEALLWPPNHQDLVNEEMGKVKRFP